MRIFEIDGRFEPGPFKHPPDRPFLLLLSMSRQHWLELKKRMERSSNATILWHSSEGDEWITDYAAFRSSDKADQITDNFDGDA